MGELHSHRRLTFLIDVSVLLRVSTEKRVADSLKPSLDVHCAKSSHMLCYFSHRVAYFTIRSFCASLDFHPYSTFPFLTAFYVSTSFSFTPAIEKESVSSALRILPNPEGLHDEIQL